MLQELAAFLNAPALTAGAAVTSRAELAGALLGVWMVLCNLRVDPLAWPLAIASAGLYILVFWQARLYGNAALQALFVTLAFWGWWQWTRGTQDAGAPLAVRHLGARGRIAAVLAAAALWPAIALLLQTGGGDAPWSDAFITAVSLVAQWLLARKYVENWPGWLAVNLVAIVLFAQAGLWLTVALYGLFAVLAVVGWYGWARRAAAAGAPLTTAAAA